MPVYVGASSKPILMQFISYHESSRDSLLEAQFTSGIVNGAQGWHPIIPINPRCTRAIPTRLMETVRGPDAFKDRKG
ncbi:hypothetical protein NTCA1_44010 [Novosphingobium sp. TCA1]|nr:hypothetical protein NTCA1_44010 [Novosphingobium sp. TCA1]